ncbi:MAG TPA: anti-sigma factor [Nocardioidaceae bacterium]|nr:anti-sigma factor [Nocardioidaceae bacterium]
MEHPDEEVLTQFALDDPLALDAATLVHISDCDRCTAEIQDIQRVVDAALAAGGRPDLQTTVAPPPSVWERVLVEVGAGSTGTADVATQPGPTALAPVETTDSFTADSYITESAEPTAPAALAAVEPVDADEPIWLFEQPGELATTASGPAQSLDRPTDRRTLWQVAVAAAVGLVLGAGVTWIVVDTDSSTTQAVTGDVKTSVLTGIDGHTTSGEISLAEGSNGAPEITINIDNLDKGPGFLQAWLLDADTGGMVALGVLDGSKGTFAVPPSLNLSHYSQVDVSREPFDGDPAHSTVSLARGPVPEA